MSLHLPPILTFTLRRVIQAIPVILLIMVGSFLLIKLAPGDTVDALVGDMGARTPPMSKGCGWNTGSTSPSMCSSGPI
ncbi:hypothetical protein [Paracoccus cavernae]|uniref:hypothetical protein n=1 Tax=Paracoccus cavernae TaxID=1571207 RepID=UPI00363467C9